MKKRLLRLLLENYKWYCRKTETLLKELELNSKEELIELLDEDMEFFVFNGIEYLGTIDQHLRYNLEKKLGINRFEQ